MTLLSLHQKRTPAARYERALNIERYGRRCARSGCPRSQRIFWDFRTRLARGWLTPRAGVLLSHYWPISLPPY